MGRQKSSTTGGQDMKHDQINSTLLKGTGTESCMSKSMVLFYILRNYGWLFLSLLLYHYPAVDYTVSYLIVQ